MRAGNDSSRPVVARSRPLLLTAAGILLAAAAWAQTPQVVSNIKCDPSVRVDNPGCPGENVCRRVSGDCGWLDGLCLDVVPGTAATATGWHWGCNTVCSNEEGRCEGGGYPCNEGCLGFETCTTVAVGDEGQEFASCLPAPDTLFALCNSDADCSVWLSCLAGICDDGECTIDEDCPGNETCSRNRCALECEDDDDCGVITGSAGEPVASFCSEDNRCVECVSDSDCGEGQCLGQVCVECRNDAGCPASDQCDQGTNSCVPRCAEGLLWADCGFILGGVSGSCVTPGVSQTCQNIAGCPVNFACCAGYCVNQCPSGPCSGDLPERPDDIPGPPGGGPPEVFMRFHRALLRGDLLGVREVVSADYRSSFTGRRGELRVARAREARPAKLEIVSQEIGHETATLRVAGAVGSRRAKGVVTLTLEDRAWKVAGEDWRLSEHGRSSPTSLDRSEDTERN